MSRRGLFVQMFFACRTPIEFTGSLFLLRVFCSVFGGMALEAYWAWLYRYIIHYSLIIIAIYFLLLDLILCNLIFVKEVFYKLLRSLTNTRSNSKKQIVLILVLIWGNLT